ncbi:PREDICTED: uncharacterized protein LOC109353842 [Lupinus angustifolius]|uniref:uncharacterized protein LOC109353842 n=1 Tax=Lupinus angustifolius TaxID=3871 RepID=UPI00092EDBF9|nr:PREDICTED: uncharacterized protein LOC109353842 [Lupinus angustifolius]
MGQRIRLDPELALQCETYFLIDNTPEEVKVKLAVVHFEGRALQWHHAFVKSLWSSSWPMWGAYVKLLIDKFGEVCDDPMVELMNLRQKGYVAKFHEEFDAVITRLELSEEYTLSCFLGGLKQEVQMMVHMFQPQSVMNAFLLAKLYEASQNSNSSFQFPFKSSKAPSFTKQSVQVKPTIPVEPSMELLRQKPRINISLTLAYMNERRAKGLCYFCDTPYTPEHNLSHKKLQFHVMEIEDISARELEKGESMDEVRSFGEPHISMNVLTGMASFRIMRVTWHYNKKPLHILIDSGSTHNFLDIEKARALGCKIDQLEPLVVTVADGNKLQISAVVKDFSWTIQHTKFILDMMLIPLDCCDVVLGIEWLVTLGDITWNFDKLTMDFVVQGRRHVLKGSSNNCVKTIRKQQLHKVLIEEVQLSMLQLCPRDGGLLQSLTTHVEEIVLSSQISQLLDNFVEVFEEPSQLPPMRDGHNHQILLLQGTTPLNKRPYRYAKHQKDIIDNLVQEMLQSRIIQNSSSPYVSHVVLVSKKDGSWRLCVDYKELNKAIVKDKFPIPLVEDLMDELHGSTVFSKLDLRVGYHQVRMNPSDIQKTAFRTHANHYEYLVMPFGLTNAPATFQGLMNAIFSQFLRKVEYLSHFILEEGVATDPATLADVKEWPLPQSLKQLRGFLGLAGYYKRFVKGYGGVFLVEVDASGTRLGVVLMQHHHPIAYISRALSLQHQSLSTYEKELMAEVFVVQKWRHYLLNRHFVINTDHSNLKYMLDQRLTTAFQ